MTAAKQPLKPPQKQQTLAIFDLDNTLLGGDSDHAWGEFLISKGLVDAQAHRASNDGFYQDYNDGTLDITAYLSFALEPIAGQSPAQLVELHNEFMREVIDTMWLNKAESLLNKHRSAGDYTLIITATNDFITRPIAKKLAVDDILASNAEIKDGIYTGKPTGIPCFKEGKVTRLNLWLEDYSFELADAWFYSDSYNDLPLLNAVGHPVVVDGDDRLLAHAESVGWQSISLRDT